VDVFISVAVVAAIDLVIADETDGLIIENQYIIDAQNILILLNLHQKANILMTNSNTLTHEVTKI